MANISRKQVAIIAIPLVAIAVLLPVAVVIGLANGGGRDETVKPRPASDVSVVEAVPSGDVIVTAQGQKWVPAEVRVKAGQVVGFKNADQMSHNVTIAGDDIAPNLDPGATAAWQAAQPGEYSLVCKIHRNTMKGTIIVEP